MTTAIIITARINSTRLPGKMMYPLNGKPVIQHLIERALSANVDKVIVMIPEGPGNQILANEAASFPIHLFRDSGKDRLGGIISAANTFGVHTFSIMDGDDLFCDPGLMVRGISQVANSYSGVKKSQALPVGAFTFAMSIDYLTSVRMEDIEEYNGVLPSIEHGLELEWQDLRLTLDYFEDYQFFGKVFHEMGIDTNIVPLYEIIDFLKTRPDIVAINAHRKADWLAHKAKA